jgi:tetratricopeptide (TPR) repeat protein
MIKKIIFIILFAVTLFAQQNPFNQNQFMLAQSYEQQGNFAKAVEIVEALNKKDPNNIQYFEKLNALYLQQKKYDESVSLITAKILLNPQDINLYGMLGSTYYTAGDRTKAYSVWDEAIKKNNGNQMAFRTMANYAIDKRDFEKAIELLNRGKESAKEPTTYSYQLGELYSITMRYREAAQEYCNLIKTNPSQYSQIENKILSYSGKPNALDETIEVVDKYKADKINIKYLLARLYVERKKYNEAFELYKEIDENQKSNGAELFTFSDFIFRDGEYETASEVFKYLMLKYPNGQNISVIKLGYAKTLEARFVQKYNAANPKWKTFFIPAKADGNEIDPVIKAYEEIIKVYQNSEVAVEANIRIGELLLNQYDDVINAEKYFKVVAINYPMSQFAPIAFSELGLISIQQAKLDDAEKYFKEVNKLARADEEDKGLANYKLAKINSYKNNFEESRKALASVLSNLKNNIANDALEFSILLNTAKNDSSNLSLYCKAEFLAEQNRFDESKNLYLRISKNPQAFVFQSIVKLRFAEMMIANNDYVSAVNNLQLIADEAEKNIYADKALYLMGGIYQYGLKDYPKAVESYESLLAKFPKSLYLNEARTNILELKKQLGNIDG